ncbi:nuclear transport factor 2 family protein [Streptomyces sp. S6]
MHAFREAVEARDMESAVALLAEDVVFNSPVVHQPYQGRAVTAAILRVVAQVFQDLRYEREVTDGADSALVFTARVGDRQLTGCDLIHVGEDGLIDELTVMVRPLSAAQALQAAMAARFGDIAADASG